jgi:broad specificity phosphatase PhoE
MKIFLVRHGEPKYKESERVNILGYVKHLRSYNDSEIKEDNQKAAKVAEIIGEEVKCISSNLKRAIHTARSVYPQNELIIDAIYRECEVPWIRMPLVARASTWKLISRVLWFLGISHRGENIFQLKYRASKAANLLIGETENKNIVLFGHFLINYFIALELKKKGWKGKFPIYLKYWSILKFEKDI